MSKDSKTRQFDDEEYNAYVIEKRNHVAAVYGHAQCALRHSCDQYHKHCSDAYACFIACQGDKQLLRS